MEMVSGRAFTALFFFALSSSVQAAPELVMHKGSSIVASMGGDTVKIVAGDGFDRSYEFDGCTLNSKMHARSGRWFGGLGIYDPAGPSFFRRECKGISRTVVEEAQIHFDDIRFANDWIRRQKKTVGKSGKVAWTNDGLLVAWNVSPNRAQLNVDVWRMCFTGQRPRELPGAVDGAIKVLPGPSGLALQECTPVGKNVVDQTRRELEEEWKKYPTSD